MMVSRSRPYRVLVVDDNTDHATLVEIVFAHLDANARLTVAWSAEEAISLLVGPGTVAQGPPIELPDVIVLDINMPGMGGMGFLEWYHNREGIGHIPVVVFTSDGDPNLAKQCFALGARDFKEKPSDFRELVPVVQRVLKRWHPASESDSA